MPRALISYPERRRTVSVPGATGGCCFTALMTRDNLATALAACVGHAAFLALSNERVWIELSGLPPSRVREYYARHNWNRLVLKMIFGADWPGVPGVAKNTRAIAALCPDDETARLVLAGNAVRVYNLKPVM